MTNQLISFKTAKLAKEKGFDIPVNHVYAETIDGSCLSKGSQEDSGDIYNYNERSGFSAPTQSLLQKWLREVHNLDVSSFPYLKDVWRYCICKLDSHPQYYSMQLAKDWSEDGYKYHTYEEAFEQGLKEALLLIK